MRVLVALAVGYAVGARAGNKDLDQVTKSFRAILESEEFADFTVAVRSQVGHALRGLAAMVDGPASEVDVETSDLVEQVRHLFARD